MKEAPDAVTPLQGRRERLERLTANLRLLGVTHSHGTRELRPFHARAGMAVASREPSQEADAIYCI